MGKELALPIINKLPDNVANDEVAETFDLISNILKGYIQSENNDCIDTKKLLADIKKW